MFAPWTYIEQAHTPKIELVTHEIYIIKLPKKGDLSKCENYRGITLLSTPCKIFKIIILECMKHVVNDSIRDNKTEFKSNRSFKDQIAVVGIIIKQSIEWNSSL